ncbi:MAG: hypothetical protein Q8L65_07120 [Burkholderiales bacterium]|nr:hypothetical protein [Burkholderiales bacterium]MDP2399505.1 hypothetical protein [Burkholderiales bacterium]
MSFLKSNEYRRYGPAIIALLWIVLGIAMANMGRQNRDIPGREDLRQVSGIVDSLHEDWRHVRHGPNIYTLRLKLRGADTEYLINSGRLNGAQVYFRLNRELRRGSPVTLWYENHPEFGNRPWQIDQQGRRLLDYRETFDHETNEQMNVWLFLIGYLVITPLALPLWWSWRKRVAAAAAEGKL